MDIGQIRQTKFFPPIVSSYANSLTLSEKLFEGREEVNGITIDTDESVYLDFDDAISLKKEGHNYLLDVSISDVASLVEINSLLDNEARERAFSRYSPYNYAPMIPEILSSDRLSLLHKQLRPTITIRIPINSNLEIVNPTVLLTKLTVSDQLSYSQGDRILEDSTHHLHQMMKDCKDLANNLLDKRKAGGALYFYDPVRGIETNEEGRLISSRKHFDSKLIIAEFMILTNKVIADMLAGKSAIFRNHNIATNREEIAPILDQIKKTKDVTELKKLINAHDQVLGRAHLATISKGHQALGLPNYLRFTSPIRRFDDLINHRIIRNIIARLPSNYTDLELEGIAKHMNFKREQVMSSRRIGRESARTRRSIIREDNNKPFTPPSSAWLNSAEPSTISKLIISTSENDDMGSSLREEIVKRLIDNGLRTKDLFHLILVCKDKTESFTQIKRGILEKLLLDKKLALTILDLAYQNLGWSKPKYETIEEKKSYATIFRTKVTVNIEDQPLESNICSAYQKKGSGDLSAINLISKIAGLDTGPLEELKLPNNLIENPIVDENSKGKLNDLYNKNTEAGWEKPIYVSRQVNESGLTYQMSSVSIKINGKEIGIEGEISAFNRKDSEQLAAEKLLKILKEQNLTQE